MTSVELIEFIYSEMVKTGRRPESVYLDREDLQNIIREIAPRNTVPDAIDDMGDVRMYGVKLVAVDRVVRFSQ